MAPAIWKLLLATTQVSSGHQCSAIETRDDQTTLLQSHVTSRKMATEETHQLNFPKISSLTDPNQRKMALAQFEDTATELALNKATVTPLVVEVCNATADLLRDMVMTAIIREHDTDVAMLDSAYAVFDAIEQRRLEYQQTIEDALDSVYGSGGLVEQHTECRIIESEKCVGCGECEDTCTETHDECDLKEVELRLRLEDVISVVSRDAYCDEHLHIHPPHEQTVITTTEHALNLPAFNAYLAALAAYEGCEGRKENVCETCEEDPVLTTGTSLLAMNHHQVSDPVHPGGLIIDGSDNIHCRNHTDIRVRCETIQRELQAAACESRHLTANYLSIYEASFLAAVNRYNQQKASVMILEADRKVEWETLERVICLLMSLTNEEDGSASSDATAELIDGCQNDFVDTSHLDIVYLPTPEMGSLPPLPKNPCDDDFADEFYADIPECEGIAEFQERYDHGLIMECVCTVEAPEEEVHHGFPYELGPYLLFQTGFELNSAAGFEVNAFGTTWTAMTGDAQYSGLLSPFVPVTLPELDVAFGLSENQRVAQVAWAYGDPQGTTDMILHGADYPETLQHRFVRTGGFVYRDAQGSVVALKEISPSSDSLGQVAQLTLYFGTPQEITESLAHAACPTMKPVTMGRIQDSGAEEYCWEFSSVVPFCEHGCFLFKTATHGYIGFPVITAPPDWAIDLDEAPEHYAATDQQGALEHSMHTGHPSGR